MPGFINLPSKCSLIRAIDSFPNTEYNFLVITFPKQNSFIEVKKKSSIFESEWHFQPSLESSNEMLFILNRYVFKIEHTFLGWRGGHLALIPSSLVFLWYEHSVFLYIHKTPITIKAMSHSAPLSTFQPRNPQNHHMGWFLFEVSLKTTWGEGGKAWSCVHFQTTEYFIRWKTIFRLFLH